MAGVEGYGKSDLVVTGNTTTTKVEAPGSGGDDGNLPVSNANAGDEGILPHGEIDPVFEAKARVLNHAVSITLFVVLNIYHTLCPWI